MWEGSVDHVTDGSIVWEEFGDTGMWLWSNQKSGDSGVCRDFVREG